MDLKRHLETAWHLTLKNKSPLILITLALSLILSVLPSFFAFISLPLLGVLSMCILGSVALPGYIFSILQMIRNDRQPKIVDLLSQHQLFFPLSAFSIVMAILVYIGFQILFFPGIAVLCALAFICLYMLPLMVDKKMGLIEAIKLSWKMAVTDNVADHWIIIILVIGLTTIGSSLIVGILFTQPFATVFTLLVYNEKISR